MMNRKIKTVCLVLVVVVLTLSNASLSWAKTDYSDAPKIDGTSAIMIDSTSGDVLYEKNADESRDPASITKILTCLVVLENNKLSDKVTITESASPIGNNIATKKGEVFTVEQLVYAMMLPSANDAARQLAIATSGDVGSFCQLMNERARECGAQQTNYTNPNGLNLAGQENHRTSARDLAAITREAMKNDKFRKIVSTVRYTIPETNMSDERKLRTTNALLFSRKSVSVEGTDFPLRYKWAIGVKTGTTSVAGNCFVGVAKKGTTEIIVVTLNSGDKTRFTDAIKMFDYAFCKYKTKIIKKPGEELEVMKVKRGETGKVSVGPAQTMSVLLSRDAEGKPIEEKTEIEINTPRDYLTAPVRKGQVVGTVLLVDAAGQTIRTCDAVAIDGVSEGGALSRIGIADDMVPLFVACVATAILIALVIVLLKRGKINIRTSRKKGRRLRRKSAKRENKDV